MGWVWWLLAPLAVTSAAAVLTWIAGRPRRPPTSEEAVSSHRRFLADLADASEPAHRTRSGDATFGDRRRRATTTAMSTPPVSAPPINTQSGSGAAGGPAHPDKLLG
jgi:hypothetical protein